MQPLDALFYPRRVAVVGASPHPDKLGHIIFRHLLRHAAARVYPVHPTAPRVLDQPAFPSLESLPADDGPVDMAVLATPAATVPELAARAARCGIPVVIPIAGGFGETGEHGRQLEARLRAAVAGSSTRILGPNTLGVLNPETGLNTFFLPEERLGTPRPGAIALISQSGAVGATLVVLAAAMGAGLATVVGLGNRVDIHEVELVEYLAAWPSVQVIGLYLESFHDGPEFLKACARARGRGVRCVAVKAGRSPGGSQAVALHTGSLAGPDRVVDGLFRQHGIHRVFDDEELVDLCLALAALPKGQPPPQPPQPPDPGAGSGAARRPRPRVAVVSCAGGHGVMLADYLESSVRGLGLALARFSEGTRARLGEVTPEFASTANPVDLTGQATVPMYAAALDAVLSDAGVDGAVLAAHLYLPYLHEEVVGGLAAVARRHPSKPVTAYVTTGTTAPDALVRFNAQGIPAYPSLWRAARALAAMLRARESPALVLTGDATEGSRLTGRPNLPPAGGIRPARGVMSAHRPTPAHHEGGDPA